MRAILLSSMFLVGCVAGVGDESSDEDLSTTTYISAAAYLDAKTWLAATTRITSDFDNIRGDTFCSGDYSNLTSTGLTCSVTSGRGIIKDCVWNFVGSSHLVNGSTGTIEASVASFQCHFKPTGGIRTVATILANGGIQRTLPGMTQSLYLSIGDCFQHPIGATATSQGTGTTYSEALDNQTTNQDQWIGAGQNVRAAFEASHPDVALRFACSVRTTTDTIRSCKWLFGNTTASIDAKSGAITVTPSMHECGVPATGNANTLSGVLSQPNPLARTLPGSTKTLNDVIASCF